MACRLHLLLLLLFHSQALAALESEPVVVQRIIDGDSLVVAATVGGIATGAAVRLRWLDTPEMRDETYGAFAEQAKTALIDMCPPGTKVRLHYPHGRAQLDGHGRVLAVVLLSDGRSLQELMIRAGWSCYWRRFGAAPEPLHQRLQQAELDAEHGRAGLHKSAPEWIAASRAEARD